MHLSGHLILIILFGYLVCCLGECKVENSELSVNLKGKALTITVPDDPDIESVFLSTEFGDRCSSNYTYVQNINKSDSFSFALDTKLESKPDMVRVLSIIETKKHIITGASDYEFDINGIATKRVIPETMATKPSACNDQKDKTIYDPVLQCILAETNSTSKKSCTGKYIFKENFEDKYLTQWTNVEYSRVQTIHAEYVAFLNNETNCYVKDNRLHIEATLSSKNIGEWFNLTKCTYNGTKLRRYRCGPHKITINHPPPVHSAALHTQKSFKIMYGRIEIRAKMPMGDFFFPYLLLHPAEKAFESDEIQPHIRIAYVRGNAKLKDYADNDIGGNILFSSVVSVNSENGRHETMMNMPIAKGSHYGDDFHNYTLIRHRDRIISKVDGVTYGIINDKMIIDSFKNTEFYLVLGLTAGGKLNFRGEYVYPKNDDKFYKPQALSNFLEAMQKEKNIRQPKLEIEHVHVFATHPDEN